MVFVAEPNAVLKCTTIDAVGYFELIGTVIAITSWIIFIASPKEARKNQVCLPRNVNRIEGDGFGDESVTTIVICIFRSPKVGAVNV